MGRGGIGRAPIGLRNVPEPFAMSVVVSLKWVPRAAYRSACVALSESFNGG